MKKNNRILKNLDFKNAIKKGQKIHCNYFSVYFLNNHLSRIRIGITVSKKVSKLAVKRNLIKRRINAALNEILINKNINKDVVIIAKTSCNEATYQQIKNDIIKIFNKIER